MMTRADLQTVKIDGAPMTFGEYYDNLDSYVRFHGITELDEEYPLPHDYARSMWIEELPIEVAAMQIAQEGC